MELKTLKSSFSPVCSWHTMMPPTSHQALSGGGWGHRVTPPPAAIVECGVEDIRPTATLGSESLNKGGTSARSFLRFWGTHSCFHPRAGSKCPDHI